MGKGVVEGKPSIKLGGCLLAPPPIPPLPFWRALEYGDAERVAECLDAGENVNQLGGPYGSTPLGWAALAADEPILRVRARSLPPPPARRRAPAFFSPSC